jgi:hypothetical protein
MPADVSWAISKELHLVLCGESHGCDWMCGYVKRAAEGFEKYAAAAMA